MKKLPLFAFLAFLLAPAVLVIGCGGGGGGSDDVGDNDVNLVACIGDSITQGYDCIGAPYPSRLASMSGKTVLNYGVGGAKSAYGVSIIGSVLARKPGYVCILFGANDAIRSEDPAVTKANLRSIVVACKNNQTIPILGTTPPMTGAHSIFNGKASTMAQIAREVAKEEGARLVDLNKAFGENLQYYNPDDGLHLSDEGGEFVARKFNSKL